MLGRGTARWLWEGEGSGVREEEVIRVWGGPWSPHDTWGRVGGNGAESGDVLMMGKALEERIKKNPQSRTPPMHDCTGSKVDPLPVRFQRLSGDVCSWTGCNAHCTLILTL